MKFNDPLLQAAHDLGVSKGDKMAKMIVNNETTVKAAKLLVQGYLESNEEVMDICPKPVSGEFADGDTPLDIIDEIAKLAGSDKLLKNTNIEDAMDESSDVLDTFEDGYSEGFWIEALKRANAILELNNID
jgi:hypothetical protein